MDNLFSETLILEMIIHKKSIMEQLIILEYKQFKEITDDIRAIKEALVNQGKMSTPKKWLTTSQAAELLNIKVRTIYLYIQKGLLHPHKAGGINLIDRSEIEALIEGE